MPRPAKDGEDTKEADDRRQRMEVPRRGEMSVYIGFRV